MRILQVNKFLYPKGGAEVVCLGLVDALRELGHEVRLFGMADEKNPAVEEADCFPSPIDYHAGRGLARKAGEALRTIYGREARRGMRRLLLRYRPEIIHAHNIYHQLTPSILGPARELGIPVLLTLHDYKLQCPVYTFLRHGEVCERCLGRLPLPLLAGRCKDGDPAAGTVLFLEAALHRLLRSYERGVTLFTSPSVFLRDKMIEGGTPAERIIHLPNALPFPREVLEAPFVAPPEKERPTLIWVGRMSHEKGLSTLLRALAACQRPLRLRLVGDGPEEFRLRELATELGLGDDRLEWLGRRGRDEIPGLIESASGSVVPSEWYENAPLSVLESLALGRPVLGSDLGGLPDMVEDGRSGWIFRAGDLASLGAALDEWAGSRELRLERGRIAHEQARERFHPDRVLDETLAIYDRVLANSRPRS
jgi:glycosyltransferase involved in cell wall biosynthesis